MKLLYWYTRYKDRNGEPIEYHGLRELELNLSTDMKFQYDSEENILYRDVCSAPLPEHFWGNPPLYNLNAIVGINGAGKTTVIYTIIDTLQELYNREVQSNNESIIVLEHEREELIVHLIGAEEDKKRGVQIPSDMKMIDVPIGKVEGCDKLLS